jgi:hypothetical protein
VLWWCDSYGYADSTNAVNTTTLIEVQTNFDPLGYDPEWLRGSCSFVFRCLMDAVRCFRAFLLVSDEAKDWVSSMRSVLATFNHQPNAEFVFYMSDDGGTVDALDSVAAIYADLPLMIALVTGG